MTQRIQPHDSYVNFYSHITLNGDDASYNESSKTYTFKPLMIKDPKQLRVDHIQLIHSFFNVTATQVILVDNQAANNTQTADCWVGLIKKGWYYVADEPSPAEGNILKALNDASFVNGVNTLTAVFKFDPVTGKIYKSSSTGVATFPTLAKLEGTGFSLGAVNEQLGMYLNTGVLATMGRFDGVGIVDLQGPDLLYCVSNELTRYDSSSHNSANLSNVLVSIPIVSKFGSIIIYNPQKVFSYNPKNPVAIDIAFYDSKLNAVSIKPFNFILKCSVFKTTDTIF